MTETELRDAVVTSLLDLAPEASPEDIDPAVPVQEQLDIDSMDYLDFLVALATKTGVEVPEIDYPLVSTVDDCVRYLAEHQAG
jgi:acyl carrier protein